MPHDIYFCLFDDGDNRLNLAPINHTKATACIRCGIFTIQERWEKWLQQNTYILTADYLQPLYADLPHGAGIFIDASVHPTKDLVELINDLAPLTAIVDEAGNIIAGYAVDKNSFKKIDNYSNKIIFNGVNRWVRASDFYLQNEAIFTQDMPLLRATSKPLPASNTLIGTVENLFIADGLTANAAIFNNLNGPIVIGKNVTIMEGACLRGPLYVGDNSVVKMGAKIYGATSIGPNCVVGGEIKNVIIQGNSNKAHDGYLGDSIIGEWCNFGAGTSNSNIKNTAGAVQMWSIAKKEYENVGIKAGLVMGDYSRCAINSSINTGTVIGTCVNFFSSSLSEKYIPSFSWGANENTSYIWEKVLSDIDNWKQLKNQFLSETEIKILEHLYKQQ